MTDGLAKLAAVIDTIGHIVIVVLVIASATFLAVRGEIKADTIATVYGAALGFTTGAAIARRPVSVRSGDTPAQRASDTTPPPENGK